METHTLQSNKADILQRMLEAGVHLGHQKSKGHPKMKPYLFTTRQSVQIINVEKTLDKLGEAGGYLKGIASKGGVILFVATKVPGKLLVKNAATEAGMPWVHERWLGGTLTNFPIVQKRLEYFLDLEQKKNQGELEKYPKKEQAMFQRELESLERMMGGLKTLKKLPDAIIVVDIGEHLAAVREAITTGIRSVAITDTNSDPTLVSYPIPANDRSTLSVSLILNELVAAIKEGKQQYVNPA